MKTSTATIAAALAACFIFTIAGAVVIAVAVPEGGNPGSLIALLLGSLAPTLAAIATLARTDNIGKQVDHLTNGLLDAKIRAGVADVIPDELLDDAAATQITQDRETRATAAAQTHSR